MDKHIDVKIDVHFEYNDFDHLEETVRSFNYVLHNLMILTQGFEYGRRTVEIDTDKWLERVWEEFRKKEYSDD